MKTTIWFASNNKNKILELKNYFANYGFTIKSLLDLDSGFDIEEDGNTYRENALIKAKTLYSYLLKNKIDDQNYVVIADDTGLEIECLNNFPGIYSNRWKKDLTFVEAMQIIIKKMENCNNRKAKMITTIVCINRNITKSFTAILNGLIVKKIKDSNGFGYDPFFYL
ncbi:MAG: non-canonical purine NTP pyrophosphatase, partial [Mycoplasma sp.]|nr:non-canonical purine NTP pyrophosphatase [Mycoplasma sp.]